MKYITRILRLEKSEIIALYYYFCTKRQISTSTFIDEITWTWGYGKLDSVGLFEYTLPFWFSNKYLSK